MQNPAHPSDAQTNPPTSVYRVAEDGTNGKAKTTPAAVTLFGLQVSNIDMDEALDWITYRARHHHKTSLNFVNAHCLNIASKDAKYHRVLRQSDRLFPDGSGIRLAMELQGVTMRDNLNGTDLFPRLCEAAAEQGLSLFLLGAAPGVAAQVAENMVKRYPTLQIAGTRDGFFTAAEEPEVIQQINRSRAHILLVAMGVPRQETWLADHRDQLDSPITMGVGGLFDFYAERISRAPKWLRDHGLEWTWRLLQEPRRMWRRYIIGNPEFVVRARHDVRGLRRKQSPEITLAGRSRSAMFRRSRWWLATRATPLAKRSLDIAVTGSALVVASPLLALTALAIRLESPGPVFFTQQRVGLRGQTFRFWKFRSMYIDAEARKAALLADNEMEGGVLFKMKDDPRITRVGRFIRRFSIDELPQLWNVIRGDMSLVGPRPALPAEVEQYSVADRRRLLAQPGITCIWQVSGRSDIPFDRQVAMDMAYIQKARLATDLNLLLKTVPAVISGRGAY